MDDLDDLEEIKLEDDAEVLMEMDTFEVKEFLTEEKQDEPTQVEEISIVASVPNDPYSLTLKTRGTKVDDKTMDEGLDELVDMPPKLDIPKTFKNDAEGELEELHECMSEEEDSVFVRMYQEESNP